MRYDPSNVREARKVSDIQGEMRVDQYLTNFSVSWRQDQDNFVGPKAATSIPVRNESDKYAIYPPGYFWRDEAEVRPLGGRPVQVRYKVESGQYLAEEWALEHTIDDRERANADSPFDLDESGVTLLEGKQLIKEDRLWAGKFFKPGVWARDFTAGTDFDPFDDASSEPIALLDSKKLLMAQATGKKPNTLVLGANVPGALRSNPDIVERIKYTQRGVASLDILASLFEVSQVLVAMAVYNAANEGAADDIDFIVDPDGMWLGYIEPTPRMNAPTAIARFGWTGLHAGANKAGGVILRGRDDRASSDWIQSRNAYDYRLISSDLGMWFTGATTPQSG